MSLLAVNVGSSSLKLAVFDGERCIDRRGVERMHDPARAFREATEGLERPDAVGHRLVHGGPEYAAPVRVDESIRSSLGRLERFAPLHLPGELAVIDAAGERWPGIPQVACFDTAFHRTMPERSQRLAVPRALFDRGVRRYGFHGLSFEYAVELLGAETLKRAVLAHLGSGASMVAVKDGRSVDTTMGLTPAGGLVMGTRTGDLDPGVLVHLMDHYGYGVRQLDAMVNGESGLLGISGTTGDMRALLDACPRDEGAELAVDIFCMTARKFVGALTAVLGGMDTLVFMGGIGEHAAAVRARICSGLAHLGVHLDPERNERAEESISAPASPCRVLIVRTDEERMIARHTARLLSRGEVGTVETGRRSSEMPR